MSGRIEEFEDLIAWQKARELTRAIYQATRQEAFAKDYGLSGQIQRAAVSIMSNISEGFERGNPREFHQFLSIAKVSCAEVRSQLYVALDAGYLNEVSFQKLMVLAKETGKVIGGLRVSVQRRRDAI
ncbi:MAG TPA: four helix bundle protein [Deltaproteobacteria bacterium]|nr:four helix bundle protein [Deltaproteobacteria bacterium]